LFLPLLARFLARLGASIGEKWNLPTRFCRDVGEGFPLAITGASPGVTAASCWSIRGSIFPIGLFDQ